MKQTVEKIKKVAMDLDNALEKRDIELIISFFSDDCEIELLQLTLKGKDGVRKWLTWMFEQVKDFTLEPVNIIVEDDVFFEEFIVKAILPNGKNLISKQAEVLIYENYKIKSLRLYFDRLDFADAITTNFISRKIVESVIKKSLEGIAD
jgi:ketosteroid isomerase-like protein